MKPQQRLESSELHRLKTWLSENPAYVLLGFGTFSNTNKGTFPASGFFIKMHLSQTFAAVKSLSPIHWPKAIGNVDSTIYLIRKYDLEDYKSIVSKKSFTMTEQLKQIVTELSETKMQHRTIQL